MGGVGAGAGNGTNDNKILILNLIDPAVCVIGQVELPLFVLPECRNIVWQISDLGVDPTGIYIFL